MRQIQTDEIITAIEKLFIEANYYISDDIKNAFICGRDRETSSLSHEILDTLIQNAEIAEAEHCAICQDTGMAVVFMEIGQDVHIAGGSLTDAVNEGVRRGYEKGYLRKSVVKDPINRVNTKDNTPAVIHTDITAGDKIRIIAAPKGFGSENMSALKMLKPSDGLDGVKKFILDTVKNGAVNACPPIVVGIGVGGTMEKAALMSKKALLRSVDSCHPDTFWAEFEDELLERINAFNIGPAGFGGITTALGVNVEVFPTHIAGLPVAVNIGCHVTRHREVIL